METFSSGATLACSTDPRHPGHQYGAEDTNAEKAQHVLHRRDRSICALLAACSGDVVDLGGGSGEEPVPAACLGPDGDGTFTITGQRELDALKGCKEIGALQIGANLDLRPLSSLRRVRESLAIIPDSLDETGYLDSLEGLESLERVGYLWLRGIAAPTLEPLSNLAEVVGGANFPEGPELRASIVIEAAAQLRSLAGLDNVLGAKHVAIAGCPELETLDGLHLPESMTTLQLSDNPKLHDLDALNEIKWVQALEIQKTGIASLNVEFGLESVVLRNNANLVEVSGLDEVIVATTIDIQDNPRLARLPELSQLQQLDLLTIKGNPQLQWLPSFPHLASGRLHPWAAIIRPLPINTLWIADNSSLQQFVAPTWLREVRYLFIEANANLNSIDLGNLEVVTELRIANNPSLTSASLARLQTVNSLKVLQNEQLPAAAFEGVQTFRRDIQGNAGEPSE